LVEFWLRKALAVTLGLFLLSVVYRGANTPSAIQAIAYLSIFALAITTYAYAQFDNVYLTRSWAFLVTALSVLLLTALASLLPLTAEQFLSLPGRGHYVEVIGSYATSVPSPSLSISVDPSGTMLSALVLLVSMSIALSIPALSRQDVMMLLGLYCIIVVLQAMLGLTQLGLASPSFLAFGSAVGGTRAAGTFVNKNHFATFLAMALPLLLMRSAGRFTFWNDATKDSKLKRAWWGFATAIVFAALISSVSRGGVAAGFAVAVLTMIACARGTQNRRKQFAFAGIAALALLVASFAGLQLFVSSLSSGGFERGVGGRQLLNTMTWSGVTAFFPVGSGLGTFAIAFPRFQLDSFTGFVEHAHNDYLQLLFEAGLAGVVVLACTFIAWILQAREVFSVRKSYGLATVSSACLLGVLAFAIHAWFDFPAHIPAVVWVAIMLAAAATHPEMIVARPRSVSTDR
jgi:O-antigen ligase